MENTRFMPLQPMLKELEIFDWKNFYNDILNKDQYALDYMIDFFDDLNKGHFSEIKDILDSFQKMYSSYVDSFSVHSHFLDFAIQKGYSKKNCREVWNMQNDILRVLKRMKTGEPLELLPEKDRKITYEFIETLKNPPIGLEKVLE